MENSRGYKSLLNSVLNDTAKDSNCFTPSGCPIKNPICCHKYCNKFKWIMDRANHYAEKLGLNPSEILDSWEKERNYWYMNYYQEANQPLIESDHVYVFETQKDLVASIKNKAFRCPMCGGISKNPYECDTGLEMEKGKTCDWKVYGLFREIGKGAFVYVKERLHGEYIFMPIVWENKSDNR